MNECMQQMGDKDHEDGATWVAKMGRHGAWRWGDKEQEDRETWSVKTV